MEDDGLFVHLMWLHRVVGGDSGALVVPFMRVGTYPTRHLATLRESELLPSFAGPYPGWTRVSGTCTGQDSEAVHTLSGLRLPMFLLNSRDPLVTATCGSSRRPDRRHPFSRSYGANLPSSLAWRIPDTPEVSRLWAPVSVLGTVTEDPSRCPFHWLRESAEPS